MVRLLAGREHSRAELRRKLSGRFASTELEPVLDDLAERGLQSDRRFAEAYAAMRQSRGYGPLAIRAELKQRGVDAALIASALDALDPDWLAQMRGLSERKFGADPPADRKQMARRGRFLAQRGFPADLIHQLLRD